MGTGARFGTPPLRLMDLGTGQIFLDMGANLKNGAGMQCSGGWEGTFGLEITLIPRVFNNVFIFICLKYFFYFY